MNRRFALLVGSLGLVTMLHSESAEAQSRVRFGGGGGVRVHASAGGSVRWSSSPRTIRHSPRWSVRGSVHVGGGYYPRYYRPYYYAPTYVPSYYGGTYYPVDATPAPATQVAYSPRPALPRFGIGLFLGGVSVEAQDDSSDLGLLGRFRLTPGMIIEGELGKTSYANDLRIDRRLGASLIYEIGAYNKLSPYLLAGIGVQQADVAGEFQTTQNFGEVGIGLRYAFNPSFHLAFDVRAGARNTMTSDGPTMVDAGTAARQISPPSSGSDQAEEYHRARLSGILYF